MKQWSLALLLGLAAFSLNAADLTPDQVEQQIQLSHMLGQISQDEQKFRIEKVRALGVDGYYEWLQNDTRPIDETVANSAE